MTFSFFPRLLLSLPTLSHSLRPLATAFCCLFSSSLAFSSGVLPLCILCMSCVSIFLVMNSIICRRFVGDLGWCVGGRISEVWLLPIERAFQRLDWHELVWRQFAFLQFGCVFPYNERMSAAPICESVVSGCHADQAFCIRPEWSVIDRNKT